MSWYSFFVTTDGSTVDFSDVVLDRDESDEGVKAAVCVVDPASIEATANLLNMMIL
jgi:hypothetical protein